MKVLSLQYNRPGQKLGPWGKDDKKCNKNGAKTTTTDTACRYCPDMCFVSRCVQPWLDWKRWVMHMCNRNIAKTMVTDAA